jgi:uncharacterized membrane protein
VPRPFRHTPATSRSRLAVAFVAGTAAGALSILSGTSILAPLVGWDVAAITIIVWSWLGEWRLDAATTAAHALRVNPGRATADVLLLVASVASIGAVAGVIAAATSHASQVTAAGVGLASVVLSWTLVHTVYAARYATVYYAAKPSIEFDEHIPPRYSDFAYLAFTIGMSYQVSDTKLTGTFVRGVVLRHALLSYGLGAVVLAATINLVAGLANRI